MSVCAAILLFASGDFPAESRWEYGDDVEVFFRARGGAWACSRFDFDFRLPSGEVVETDGEVLGSAGLDVGVTAFGHLQALLTAEANVSDDILAEVYGVSLGYREYASPGVSRWVPSEGTLYGGPFYGRFDVRDGDFGDFEDSFGGRVGMALSWALGGRLVVSLVGEYRYVTFEYEDDVLDGDDDVGGSGFWAGLGLDVRF